MSGDKRPSFVRKTRLPRKNGQRLATPVAEEPVAAAPAHTHARGEHERIVVPRQERGDSRSDLDVELREIRWGATSRGAYLRVVPSRRRFKRVGAGHITATLESSTPVGRLERILQAVKRVLLGNPFASSQIIHERLNKMKALAIFSSDALSSSAYATEEILLVLILAGSGSLHYSLPIAAVIAALIIVVTVSYRQTIRAYPGGGGAYIVAYTNLGRVAGLVAGAALLVDYVLTVSVSTSAGVAAVTSAAPSLHPGSVPIGVFVIGLITLGNLRGIREAGSIFAIPTYFFIVCTVALIVIGVFKVMAGDAPGSVLHEPTPAQVEATKGLGLFLVLRAFSSGCAALTGIEAISNGVPSFESPEVPNARTTMAWMAGILIFLFVGITFLANRFALVPADALTGGHETIISQLGRNVFGKNLVYYAFQVGTALVLFLAANTSYSAFPPLGANLARDRFLPRHFSFRGDRLAYSNGILILSVAAIGLVVAFQADVNKLIPLYALGVFISFTLSQYGMVVHLRREKPNGWKYAAAVSAFGGCATFVVAIIIGLSKFVAGAYISILMMLAMMGVFALIRRHYDWYEHAIAPDEGEASQGMATASPLDAAGRPDHIVVPVDGINKITLGAIQMARALSSSVTAVHLTDDAAQAEHFREQWEEQLPDVPLLIIESPYRAFAAPMLAYIDSLRRTEADRRITVILPAFKAHHWYERLLHNQAIRNLKPFLDETPEVRVVEFDYEVPRTGKKPPTSPTPSAA
ncbi:MAG: APC family permease [Chloroflexota bacterium]